MHNHKPTNEQTRSTLIELKWPICPHVDTYRENLESNLAQFIPRVTFRSNSMVGDCMYFQMSLSVSSWQYHICEESQSACQP